MPLARSCLHSSGYATEDRFWDKLGKQGAYLGNNIGVLCTASGKWLGDKDIDKALTAWNKLPESDRKPGAVKIEERGPFDPKKTVQPPVGGLIVRTYTRSLERDGKGQLSASAKVKILGSGTTVNAEPNRDFLWLTEAESKSLVPASPKKGDKLQVPAAIRNRIFRFHLRDSAWCLGGIWSLEQVRSGDLGIEVEDLSPTEVRMKLKGSALLASDANRTKAQEGYDVQLLGDLTWDVKKKAFSRFDVVAVGDYWGRLHETVNGVKPGPYRYPLAIAFELAENSQMDQVPPRGTRLVTGSAESAKDYFRP